MMAYAAIPVRVARNTGFCVVFAAASSWSLAQVINWPDRTVGLGPDRTGLICKQSGPKIWDRTTCGPVFYFNTEYFSLVLDW